MKKIKELDFEVKFAGIFGAIAIIAICIEIILGNFSIDSIIAGIKDLAGTIVAVLVFIIAIKSIKPESNKNFIDYYENKMMMLVKKYNPLLQKSEVSEKEDLSIQEARKAKKLTTIDRYDLNTNAGALFGDNHGKMARFCEIAKESCNYITFSLNYSMFGYSEKTEINQLNMQVIGQKIRCFVINYINTHFENNDVDSVEFDVKNLDIKVNFKKILNNEEDAEMLVEIIDCVLINCLILSGREIKITN